MIPFVGDFADLILNYTLVVRIAKKAELPDWLLHRMYLNNLVSAVAGFIPVVGDVVLATYKANSRNAALLEEFLRIRGEEFLKHEAERNGQTVAAVQPGAGREKGEHVEGAPPPKKGFLSLLPGKASGSGGGGGPSGTANMV